MSQARNQSIILVTREAIDPSGHPGSLYDAHRDCIITITNSQRVLSQPNKCPLCTLGGEDQNGTDNLIEFFEFDDELRLSIVLKLTPVTKMTSFIDSPHQIDNYTRILHYSYENQVEQLSDDKTTTRDSTQLSDIVPDVTHVITAVSKGIDIYIIMQLPHEVQLIEKIDAVLRKIQSLLNNNQNDIDITTEEINLLDKITETTCYSNIEKLSPQSTVYDFYRYIQENKNNNSVYLPIKYTLQPVKWFYHKYEEKRGAFNSLPFQLIHQIKQLGLQLQNMLKKLHTSVPDTWSKSLDTNQEKNFQHIKTQLSNLETQCNNRIELLSKLVIQRRSDKNNQSELNEALNSNNEKELQHSIDNLIQDIEKLMKENESNTSLNEKSVEYTNDVDSEADSYKVNNSTEYKTNDDNVATQCTSPETILIERDSLSLDEINQPIEIDDQERFEIESTDSDFHSCSSEQDDMFSSSTKEEGDNTNQCTGSTISDAQKLNTLSSTTPAETINILLLGETGVGKSTFINALANYLAFDTLTEAESKEPVVLMSVSFEMTVGDNFEEKIVKLGTVDNDINEDFNHPGQSVTQKCRSYLFNLKQNVKQELCIIDTPGFGDTRGIDQDELNMTHILEYVNNLTHLNAVCFLLKPNSSRLDISFRSCFTQLLNFLGSNSLRNVIFCFTNTRSTFYAPGNTLPLLKEMFASLSIGDIQLKKENTFCFDSESFRYLVALQNGIDCSGLNRTEYEKSWSISMKESNRLIQYIRMSLNIFDMKSKCQSTKFGQWQIIRMIRPISETIRNILRNLVILNSNFSDKSIELHPEIIYRPAFLCFQCNQKFIDCENFWITEEVSHEFQDECLVCSCPSNLHIPIDYLIKSKLVNNPSKYGMNEMKDQLTLLCNASAMFTYFLIHVIYTADKDDFLISLRRMIDEENDICDQLKSNDLNLQMLTNLTQFKEQYEQTLNEIKSNPTDKKLDNIDELIEKIQAMPMIEEQLIAISVGHE